MPNPIDELQDNPQPGYDQSGLSGVRNIHMDSKKTVNLGGSAETPFGSIDTSFKTIYNDIFRFRKINRDPSLGVADQLLYALDQPAHYYFKLFFYFSNPYSDPSNPLSANLLGTAYTEENTTGKMKTSESTNTALKYLYNNMEYTRFNRLAEFIQLLSDISTKCPWYFQSITGLDQALDRTEVGQSFSIEGERKQILIKCLPDAYDNRIGRLLDLYRTVVYSQNLHKWILPSNLRKFDMGIYIFNSPIKTISGGRYGVSGDISDRVLETTFKDYYGDSSEDSGEYSTQMYKEPADFTMTGCKYIELRGCEIDYNSSKSVYSELNNAEGFGMEYDITIRFDSAVEDRYDPIFKKYVGDFVIEDLLGDTVSTPNEDAPYSGVNELDEYSSGVIGDPFGADRQSTLLESAMGMGIGYLSTMVNKIMLGNIYGFSFGKLDAILESDPMEAALRTARGVNNARLIAKRISDFTDPDKGTRELSGKRFYDRPYYSGQPLIGHGAPHGPLAGKTFRRPEDHPDEDWDIEGKTFRTTEDHQDIDGPLEGKSFHRPEDHQDEDWDINGKNMYNGWLVTPIEGFGPTLEGKTFRRPEDHPDEDWDIEGKTFRRPDTDHQDLDYDISGKSFHRPEDHPDEDWDIEGKTFVRPEDHQDEDWDISGRNIYQS